MQFTYKLGIYVYIICIYYLGSIHVTWLTLYLYVLIKHVNIQRYSNRIHFVS